MANKPIELAVIGSGPGGYKVAVSAAHLGARVTLIEKGLPGGTCLNQGCVPKKTLLYLAALIEDVNALNGQGLEGQVRGNFSAALSHKDKVVEGIRDNFPVWLRRLGVRVLKGEAAFLDERRIQVEGEDAQILSPDRIVIATGAVPREHPACPADGVHILNSQDFMFRLRHLPRSVLCLGGGAIGTELGFLLHQFGSRVTMVEQAERLLDKPNIPARASALLERKFRRLGVEVRKGLTVTAARIEGGEVEVTLS
ncbi:MAG: NAD(P)/FAD-dependent oxidoreductase, partial [Gammaproteobacteria bacterium]